MKKDYTRDYITQAFRRYAATVPQEEKLLSEPEQADIEAVRKTIKTLERGGKEYIVSAIRAIYFQNPKAPLRKGDISARVHKFSLAYPVSEKQAYAWLKYARMICADFRGLSKN